MTYFKKIARLQLYRVASLNGLSVGLRILAGVVSSKVLAVYVGPAGMTLVAHLRNALSALETVGLLGFQNGVVKYLAEYKTNPDRQKAFLGAILPWLLLVWLLVGVLLYAFSGFWSDVVFGAGTSLSDVVKILAFFAPLLFASVFSTLVLNGLGAYRKLLYANIFGNLTGLALSVWLIVEHQTKGALLALILAPTLLLVANLYQLRGLLRWPGFNFGNSTSVFRNLGAFSLMALVSALIGPLVFIGIRHKLVEGWGMEAGGYWEGMQRIASYYFLFISTLITLYFFPRLSSARTPLQTGRVFWAYFRGVLPVFFAGLLLVYLLRSWIVIFLFSAEFEPMESLFLWQLAGDFFKAASLVLGYGFFAKKLTRAFIVAELLSLGTLYVTSVSFIAMAGVEGVVAAHAFTYFIYFIGLAMYFRRPLLLAR